MAAQVRVLYFPPSFAPDVTSAEKHALRRQGSDVRIVSGAPGLIAQWSERSAHNRGVAGSSPAETTKKLDRLGVLRYTVIHEFRSKFFLQPVKQFYGKMAEWLIALAWKASDRKVTWVRIPVFPPKSLRRESLMRGRAVGSLTVSYAVGRRFESFPPHPVQGLRSALFIGLVIPRSQVRALPLVKPKKQLV